MRSERYLIHIGGGPGSGKSRMARRLVEQLDQRSSLSSEHISLGDRLRMIQRGEAVLWSLYSSQIREHLDNPNNSTVPLPEPIATSVINDALASSDEKGVDVVLVDGYPRSAAQVADYFELAALGGRHTPGTLLAIAPDATALQRMITRGNQHVDRSITLTDARAKLARHQQVYPEVLDQFRHIRARDFAIETIDTSGPRLQTDQFAYQALQRLLKLDSPDKRAA